MRRISLLSFARLSLKAPKAQEGGQRDVMRGVGGGALFAVAAQSKGSVVLRALLSSTRIEEATVTCWIISHADCFCHDPRSIDFVCRQTGESLRRSKAQVESR